MSDKPVEGPHQVTWLYRGRPVRPDRAAVFAEADGDALVPPGGSGSSGGSAHVTGPTPVGRHRFGGPQGRSGK